VICLADIVSWQTVCGVVSCFKANGHIPDRVNWTAKAKENWVRITSILDQIEAKWFAIGDVELKMTRDVRKCCAETYIKMIARIQPLLPSNLHHVGPDWASDRSMIPAASSIGETKLVTTALIGPLTLILRISGRNISILEGELMGLVAGLLMALENLQSSTLHSDHLNSV
jgi:hypothetical protein